MRFLGMRDNHGLVFQEFSETLHGCMLQLFTNLRIYDTMMLVGNSLLGSQGYQ
jgi:hypothetical protein